MVNSCLKDVKETVLMLITAVLNMQLTVHCLKKRTVWSLNSQQVSEICKEQVVAWKIKKKKSFNSYNTCLKYAKNSLKFEQSTAV